MPVLKARDAALLSVSLLVTLSAAAWAHATGISAGQVSGLAWLPRIAVVILLIGAVFAYLSRDMYGGSLSRGFDVLAAGFLIYGLVWWPHKIGWHGGGEPAWAGIIAPAWQTFFHLLTVMTLVVVGYGFYLLWKAGRR